jgi:hypothetical protein
MSDDRSPNALTRMMNLEDARKHLRLHSNSYSRMGMVLGLVGILAWEDWLTLLGENWSCCDNIRTYRKALRSRLGVRGPLRAMMTAKENAAYDELPDLLTCYRGCDSSITLGASWTLDWDVANSFPFTKRYMVPSPVVVTGTVKKNRVLSLKLDRDEAEIISFSVRKTDVQPADKSRADEIHRLRHTALMNEVKVEMQKSQSGSEANEKLGLALNRVNDTLISSEPEHLGFNPALGQAKYGPNPT